MYQDIKINSSHEGYNVKWHFGHGVGQGDTLTGFFSSRNYHKRNDRAFMLGRIRNGIRSGKIQEAMAVKVEVSSNWKWEELFGNLDFPLGCWHGGDLNPYPNCWDNPTKEFLEIPDGICPLPEQRIDLPEKYILFHGEGSVTDRHLNSPQIVEDLKKYGLPIVRTGKGQLSYFPVDLDYVNKTTLPQLYYIIHHAQFIVSAITFTRCFSSIWGKRVIELGQNLPPWLIDKTYREYANGEYGVEESSGLNKFVLFPSPEWDKFIKERQWRSDD